jgi:hypothetical protein
LLLPFSNYFLLPWGILSWNKLTYSIEHNIVIEGRVGWAKNQLLLLPEIKHLYISCTQNKFNGEKEPKNKKNDISRLAHAVKKSTELCNYFFTLFDDSITNFVYIYTKKYFIIFFNDKRNIFRLWYSFKRVEPINSSRARKQFNLFLIFRYLT